MKTKDKIQLLIGDHVDIELFNVALEESHKLLMSFRMTLKLENTDDKKMKCIQSKLKRTKKDIKELLIKTQTLLELVKEFNKIEIRKMEMIEQISDFVDFSDSLKELEILTAAGTEEDEEDEIDEECELDEIEVIDINLDHIDYSFNLAKNILTQAISKLIFHFELKKLEKKYLKKLEAEKIKVLPQRKSSKAEYTEAIVVEKETEATTMNEPSDSSRYSQLFKYKGYELFNYLNTEYTRDNSNPKAKYSYLFHFLSYQELLICTKLNWIAFIQSEMNIHLSRIQDKTPKYEDIIFPLLSRLKADFDKIHKVEMN